MNTEVTTTKTTMPANLIETPWGSEGADSHDMLIPRLMLQQPLSDYVAKGKATPGDIVESINGDTVAKKGESIEIIPITTFKTWMRYKQVQGKWEFEEQVPFSVSNAGWQYEETKDGIVWRNDSVLNFFVLLATKLTELPHLLAFKRSSYHTGRKLSTHFQTASMKKMPAAATVFKLSAQLTTVDKNSFWTFNLEKSRDSKKEELSTAYSWWETLRSKNVKTDDDEKVPF